MQIQKLASGELFERIEYSDSGTPEIPIVACGDGQPMPAGGRRDVAVFDGHAQAGLVEQPLLFSPYMRYRHVEPVNSPSERFHKTCQPSLEGLTPRSVLERCFTLHLTWRMTTIVTATILCGLHQDTCVPA